MTNFHIGSVNGQTVQIGDNGRQYNGPEPVEDELARLGVAIDRYASRRPDATAARCALRALRLACLSEPKDVPRARHVAGVLTATTAAVPTISTDVARVLSRMVL